MQTIDFHGRPLRRWTCGPSAFLALPERGARLMNWNVRMADGNVRDVIHWPGDADFDAFAKVRGGNPILFPFAGLCRHNGEPGRWCDPDGTVRPMPRHGFARDGLFELTASDDAGFTAELRPGDRTRGAYPFDYRFSVRYQFEPLAFKVFLRLENRGNRPIPWSAGHHPYFKLPWHPGLSRADYRYRIPAKKCFALGSDGEPVPIKPFEKEAAFDEHATDLARAFTRLNADAAVFGPKGGEEDVAVRLLRDGGAHSTWNAFVVWTETPDSPFHCVEPWMGPPGATEHGKGLHFVEPGAAATFGVEVALV